MNIRYDINPQSFSFQRSFYEASKKLPDDERLKFYDGIAQLAFDRIDPSADPSADISNQLAIAFDLALPQVEVSAIKAHGGASGGRPRKSGS